MRGGGGGGAVVKRCRERWFIIRMRASLSALACSKRHGFFGLDWTAVVHRTGWRLHRSTSRSTMLCWESAQTAAEGDHGPQRSRRLWSAVDQIDVAVFFSSVIDSARCCCVRVASTHAQPLALHPLLTLLLLGASFCV